MVTPNINLAFDAFPFCKAIARKFENLNLSIKRKQNSLRFLKSCLKNKIVPKTLKCQKIFTNFDNHPFPLIYKILLLNRVRTHKQELNRLFPKKQHLFNLLRTSLPPWAFNLILLVINNRTERLSSNHRNHLNNKLDQLFRSSPWVNFSRPNTVNNLSNHELSQDELGVLGLGLSFSQNPTKMNILKSIPQFINNKNCLPIVLEKYKCPNQNLPDKYVKALKSIQQNKNIIIRRADKGGGIVILNYNDYIDKMNTHLNQPEIYTQLENDPLPNSINCFKQIVKPLLPPDIYKSVCVSQPVLPYIYGVPKIHKPHVPLRPIISAKKDPFCKLNKWLSTFLSPLLGQISGKHIKNNLDLISKLGPQIPPQHDMISFDVTNLFTNIPIDQTLHFLSLLLEERQLPIPKTHFIHLIQICFQQNVFKFGNHFYKQIQGASMGGSLSPIIASIYMEYFESSLLPTIPTYQFIHSWWRYVDDVLLIIPKSFPTQQCLQQINNLEPLIQFTAESSNLNTIPFLDILIHFNHNRFQFSVYRKPTFAGSFIHFFSEHPHYIKNNILQSQFIRAYRISSPFKLQTEIDFLYQLFKQLGFSSQTINKQQRLAKIKLHNPPPNDPPNPIEQRPPSYILPYTSNLLGLKYTFKKYLNINLIFQFPNKIQTLLINNQITHTPLNMGVYIIPCTNCDAVYVGETLKSLADRLHQHQLSIRRGDHSNAVFIHKNYLGHNIDFNRSDLIFKSCNRALNRMIEALFISKYNNYNSSSGFYKIDSSLSSLISKFISIPNNDVTKLLTPKE